MAEVYQKEQNLIKRLAEMSGLVVCYSGGVDSSFLLAQALTQSISVTAVIIKSESLSAEEFSSAIRRARLLGIEPHVIEVEELAEPLLAANPTNRCYYCKQISYREICGFAAAKGLGQVVDGTNVEDLGDYRPGLKAKEEFGVISPLALVGLTKAEIRHLSKKMGLETWDKPASPCLNSRVPYGQPIDLKKLGQIESSEAFLRTLGLKELRVRHHGDVARVEVLEQDMPVVLAHRDQIVEAFRRFGFSWVSMDLAGFTSGSLNHKVDRGA